MSRKNKLLKFTENLTFPNVYECMDFGNPLLQGKDGIPVPMKGQWNKHFGNDNPITLELACGRGEYSLELARRNPNKNFLGVDIKGARIWKGAKIALSENLDNVAFLRTRIESITDHLAENEIETIWITFPDPFLRDAKVNRRLTAPHFLEKYHQFIQRDGLINLKTDSPELYEFTLEVIEEKGIKMLVNNSDIYAGALPYPDLDIKTYYEKQHLENERTIKFIQFTLD